MDKRESLYPEVYAIKPLVVLNYITNGLQGYPRSGMAFDCKLSSEHAFLP